MRNKFFLISFIILITSCVNVYSQSSPLNDPNWTLNTAKSDEFNAARLDSTKWHQLDACNGDIAWGCGSMFTPSHAMVDGVGHLDIQIDSSGGASPCFPNGKLTGGVMTLDTTYSYGYYETYAKLPGYSHLGADKADDFWPTFWTCTYADLYNNKCIHNENDILEPGPAQYLGNTNVCGYWHEVTRATCPNTYGITKFIQSSYTIPSPGNFYSAYHKFASEWGPNRVIYYIDDVPFSATYNDVRLNAEGGQQVMIDQQLISMSGGCPFYLSHDNPGMTWPQHYLTDYFHYYTLNLDCSNSSTLADQTAFNAFVFKVKSSIAIGNGSNSITLASTDKKYFRAVNTITVNGNFTVPLGAELHLIPTPCN